MNFNSRVIAPKARSLTNMLITGLLLLCAVLKADAHKTTTESTIIPAGINTPGPIDTITFQTGVPPVESVRTICRTVTHTPNYDTTIPTTHVKTTQTTTTTITVSKARKTAESTNVTSIPITAPSNATATESTLTSLSSAIVPSNATFAGATSTSLPPATGAGSILKPASLELGYLKLLLVCWQLLGYMQ